MAYSTDKGRTWSKYSGNPVIHNTENPPVFGGPKVFWHESSSKWVMLLAAENVAQEQFVKTSAVWRTTSPT
ncbi:hypothetical protein GI584_19125 [Gracilibacillus salitolerans]|uniref:Glycosyl hydrolase family 32 N-terminal domain-containing protein n=1 Tax=Gracilibacillus salitolerans TaxID=2663022 RepID=A0A5Q2TPS6_9BACI|nr:hypothetical protein GI584_19125 [Gracilibacillus salitolerans]